MKTSQSTAGKDDAPQVRRAKPFLRWAGSKRKQLHRLVPFWNTTYSRYVEPFAGSACLFFELAPNVAILGDTNSSLIEVYHVVRECPDLLYDRLCRIKRDEPTYYRWRSKVPEELDLETRALRFIYLNRNCFNGIFRTNVKGEFNVPIGKRTGVYFTREDLRLCASLLSRTELINEDFAETIGRVKAGDFVYLDPPFAVTSRRIFRQYGAKPFVPADVSRLEAALQRIVKKKADFLVSYADCKEARALAKNWNSVRTPIRRHVAGFSIKRRIAYEWLITNTSIST